MCVITRCHTHVARLHAPACRYNWTALLAPCVPTEKHSESRHRFGGFRGKGGEYLHAPIAGVASLLPSSVQLRARRQSWLASSQRDTLIGWREIPYLWQRLASLFRHARAVCLASRALVPESGGGGDEETGFASASPPLGEQMQRVQRQDADPLSIRLRWA